MDNPDEVKQFNLTIENIIIRTFDPKSHLSSSKHRDTARQIHQLIKELVK